MKLSDYKKDFYEFSGLASSSTRQLAFAGIALIWIFKVSNGGSYALPKELMYPATALIICLAADMLQYVIGALIWGVFHRYHEKKRSSIEEDPVIEACPIYNWPIYIFYYLKIISVLIAYYWLLSYSLKIIKFI